MEKKASDSGCKTTDKCISASDDHDKEHDEAFNQGIRYRTADGGFSDIKFHEEIMAGVDDTDLRMLSAIRAVTKLGLTRDQAEEAFRVKLPLDLDPTPYYFTESELEEFHARLRARKPY